MTAMLDRKHGLLSLSVPELPPGARRSVIRQETGCALGLPHRPQRADGAARSPVPHRARQVIGVHVCQPSQCHSRVSQSFFPCTYMFLLNNASRRWHAIEEFLQTSTPMTRRVDVEEQQLSTFLRYVVYGDDGVDSGAFGRRFCASAAHSCLLQNQCAMLRTYLAVQHATWTLCNAAMSSSSG